MERLKHIKESLVASVEGQIGHLDTVDTKELGEAIDMIKDLEEAMYYCSIVKAMEEKEEEKEKHHHYYTERYIYPEDYYRMMDKDIGRMYYGGYSQKRDEMGRFVPETGNRGINRQGGESQTDSKYYTERELPLEMRDRREGRSPISRRMYMESKEMHKDKVTKIQDLDKYLQELSSDITEMIEDASPEEQQHAAKKISSLATKISQLS